MSKRNYHHGNLKSVLLDTAMGLLEEQAIEDISMKQLSELVGVSHNAPYRHFKNKKALEASMAERGFNMLTEQLQQAGSNQDQALIARFSDMGKAYIDFGLKNPDLYRLMYGNTDLSPKSFPELTLAIQDTRKQLLDMIARCQEEGVIKKGKKRLQAMTVWASVHGLTMLMIDGQLPTKELDEMLEVSTQTLLNGLQN